MRERRRRRPRRRAAARAAPTARRRGRRTGSAARRAASRIELAHAADARRGRRDDDLVRRSKTLDEAPRQRRRLVPVAAVQVHLPAARLLGGEDDLVPEPLQHAHGRARGLGEDRVAEAGDEERDAHRCQVRSYALSTCAVPRSRGEPLGVAACAGTPRRDRPRPRADSRSRRAAAGRRSRTPRGASGARRARRPRPAPPRARLVDEQRLRVGRLDVHHRLDHRVDLALDVVRLVDHERDRASASGAACAISRMMRKSSNGSIAPDDQVVVGVLAVVEVEAAEQPLGEQHRHDLLDVRSLRVVAGVDEHLRLRPEPAAHQRRGAPVGQVGAVEGRLEELVLDEQPIPRAAARRAPRGPPVSRA